MYTLLLDICSTYLFAGMKTYLNFMSRLPYVMFTLVN